MGQKTHPYGFRVGFNKDWKSLWFSKGKTYKEQLHNDLTIRKMVKKQHKHAGISSIEIKRVSDTIRIQINTARPGIIIGRGGKGILEIKKMIKGIEKRPEDKILIDVIEVKYPEVVAQLVAEGVAFQLQRRIAFRRAMRKAVDSSLRAGAVGIKIRLAGRLGGAEIARAEWYLFGKLPLQTLKADIDYGFTEANTDYGNIGVKVWIYMKDKEKQRYQKKELTIK